MADKRLLVLHYPKCSTCKKALRWLDERGVRYEARDIVADNPTAQELYAWLEASGLPARRLFNTSGQLYRAQNVKARLDEGISDEEACGLLSTNGMLVKRPLVVGEDSDGRTFVLAGFREAEWESRLL